MSQTLNSIPAFDGTNYGYWKVRMRFFLKSINCWGIVETGWTKPEDATPELARQKNARLSNDQALHALCQALSPLKKHGKSWKQHMKARNLLNLPNFKC
jgi:hypothetical protein